MFPEKEFYTKSVPIVNEKDIITNFYFMLFISQESFGMLEMH